jgi:hypothetical protein
MAHLPIEEQSENSSSGLALITEDEFFGVYIVDPIVDFRLSSPY